MQRAFEKAEEEKRQIKETDEARELSSWVTAFEWLIQDARYKAVRVIVDHWMVLTTIERWKQEQEKNAAGENLDEDEVFDDGEDDEGVEEGVEESVRAGRLSLPYHADFFAFQFEDESWKWDPDEDWDEDNAAGDDY
ncbi:hypothetical protein O988_04063 [Pseudogymnoascus sp. VKM F-3808]|nr:hypothetical protein O988_04063 [Pseudogymnoascus sp. VKM F-3808]